MTIKTIISKSVAELERSGILTANLDARVLLEDAINKDASEIFSHPEMPLTNAQYARFRSYIKRRKAGEPVAYITGHKEFYGYDFFVNKNVLIPRPETELLVEQAIDFISSHCEKAGQSVAEAIRSRSLASSRDDADVRLPRSPELLGPKGPLWGNDRKKELSIVDIGTGSGCIVISLALCLKTINYQLKTSFFASDISKKALYIARKNAKLHHVNEDIRFFTSNLFANKKMPKKYDIIIANLPYVPFKTKNYKLTTNNLKYEPQSSIFANDNGTQIIKQFLDQAKERIYKDGLILIEVDPRNAESILKYSRQIFVNSDNQIIKDLSGLHRIVRVLY